MEIQQALNLLDKIERDKDRADCYVRSRDIELLREYLENIENAILDFKLAREAHWNAIADDRIDGLEIYDNIIKRLEAKDEQKS